MTTNEYGRMFPNSGIDELDLKLAVELEVDARQSDGVIAAKLGTNLMTVRRRRQRLIETGAITIAAITDPSSIGFNIKAFIALSVNAGKSDVVAHELQACPGVGSIILTTGRYDIVTFVAFRDLQGVISFVDRDLSRIPDVLSAEQMIILDFPKQSWRYLRPKTSKIEQFTCADLNESDMKLVGALELNPTESVIGLGKRLGMDRKVVGRNLRRLLDANITKVVAIVEPKLFGIGTQAIIFVRVRPGSVNSVAAALAAEQRIPHVAIISGHFSIFASGNFRDLEEMFAFIRTELGNIPGVLSHETMICVAVPKRSFAWFVDRQL